ncbi:MAG: hypothetical protein HYY18_17705 [Planctomycetes bacterium]|nr:hypothetical protein [Planctomycetota bacterium]
MKPAFLLILCLAAAPLLARAGEPVVFEGPEKATRAELEKCAAALTKRLAAAGLKGMKATAVEKEGKRTVEVTSKEEIPGEIRWRIETFAAFAAQKPVLKFSRQLTEEEKAQGFSLQKVDDPKTAEAPRGTTWAFGLGVDLKPDRRYGLGDVVVLLRDAPYVSWSELSILAKSDSEWTLKLTAASTRLLLEDSTKGAKDKTAPYTWVRITFDTFCLVHDTQVMLSNDKGPLKEGTIALPAALAENLEIILRNPMPYALKRTGAGK